MSAAAAASSSRFNFWPFGIIAALVVFMAGTVTLVVVAVTGRNDLVSADYYEQEIGYQKRLEHLNRTHPWDSQIQVSLGEAPREVVVRLPAEHAARGLKGNVDFYRPAGAVMDRRVALAVDAEGRQHIRVGDDAAHGLWKVRLSWTVGGEEFYAERELVLPATGR